MTFSVCKYWILVFKNRFYSSPESGLHCKMWIMTFSVRINIGFYFFKNGF